MAAVNVDNGFSGVGELFFISGFYLWCFVFGLLLLRRILYTQVPRLLRFVYTRNIPGRRETVNSPESQKQDLELNSLYDR